MNQTRCIVILSILALFVASVSVAGNLSTGCFSKGF